MSAFAEAPARETGEAPRQSAARQAYWTALLANAGIAVVKILFSVVGYNSLFVLDGLVSAALATHIAATLIGMSMARPAFYCRRYAYGQGKVQFMLSLVLGGALVVAAALALGLTIKRFGWAVHVDTSAVSVGVAIVSTLVNVMLALHLRRPAAGVFAVDFRRAARLQALGIASSVSVLQSTILVGYRWIIAERIGRITIALIMLYLAVVIIRDALEGVMDRSTGEEAETRIRELAASVEPVREVRGVRTRQVGKVVHVDLEVCLDGQTAIARCDRVAAEIKRTLSRKMNQPEHAINVSYCTD